MSTVAIQELADRLAIRDVMALYARGLDRRDFDAVASCFAEDAYADYGGPTAPAEGRDAILKIVRVVERFILTMHFMGDQTVTLRGDEADVETYAIDQLRYEKDGVQYDMTGGLRYEDKMVREDGRWVIKHRVMHTDWRRYDRVETGPGPF